MNENNSLWNRPLSIPKALANLSKGELLELRDKLQVGLRRREFLVSPAGYNTVVSRQLERIEEIKRDIQSFLDSRSLLAQEVEQISLALKRIDEINLSRVKLKEAKGSPKKAQLSLEDLIARAMKRGLSQEGLDNMKKMGLDLSSVLSTMV